MLDTPRPCVVCCRQMAKYPPKSAIEAAGHELKVNPPKQLAKTARKFGKSDAKKQRVAIMMSKARKSGG